MSDAARDTERLDRAIERLTSNQPVPVFEDDDLEDLLQLAGRLHRELPDDLPDPLFRDGLREQILDPRPRPVPAAPEVREKSRFRNPLAAAGGALAAVVVMAVAVGIVASGQFGGGDTNADQQANAEFLSDPRSTVSMVATATATIGGVAVATTREAEPATMTATPEMPPLPPLDSAHVEMGAMTTFETTRSVAADEISYMLASDMPVAQETAHVYRFAVPDVDAMSLFNDVSDALDLDGEMKTRSVRGKTVISFTSTSGTTFTWMPGSGAFACSLSGEASIQGDPEQMVTEAYAWLRSSGFPLRDPAPEPVVHTMENGMVQVDFPVELAPDVAVGHPLSVSVMIDRKGEIKSVTGYWLQLVDTRQMGMLTPEEAWQQLADGKGFWSSRSPIDESGTFEVDSFAVVYVLTVDDHGEVILQPVYRATGTYRDYRGQIVDGVSVMVPAVSQESN